MTEQQQTQIRAEEIFRHELRRSLDAQKPAPSGPAKVWALLNSSFVLWLLSTVLVSLVTALYTAYQSAEAERLRKQTLLQRLDTEIGNRIYYAGIDLELIMRNTEYQARARPDGKETLGWTVSSLHKRIASFLDNSVPNLDQSAAGPLFDVSAFAEYRSSNFRTLVIELGRLVPDGAGALQGSLDAYEKSVTLGADLSLGRPAPLEEQVKAINEVTSLLHTEIELPRWRLGINPASSN